MEENKNKNDLALRLKKILKNISPKALSEKIEAKRAEKEVKKIAEAEELERKAQKEQEWQKVQQERFAKVASKKDDSKIKTVEIIETNDIDRFACPEPYKNELGKFGAVPAEEIVIQTKYGPIVKIQRKNAEETDDIYTIIYKGFLPTMGEDGKINVTYHEVQLERYGSYTMDIYHDSYSLVTRNNDGTFTYSKESFCEKTAPMAPYVNGKNVKYIPVFEKFETIFNATVKKIEQELKKENSRNC